MECKGLPQEGKGCVAMENGLQCTGFEPYHGEGWLPYLHLYNFPSEAIVQPLAEQFTAVIDSNGATIHHGNSFHPCGIYATGITGQVASC